MVPTVGEDIDPLGSTKSNQLMAHLRMEQTACRQDELIPTSFPGGVIPAGLLSQAQRDPVKLTQMAC
jgi:hypothetical protein